MRKWGNEEMKKWANDVANDVSKWREQNSASGLDCSPARKTPLSGDWLARYRRATDYGSKSSSERTHSSYSLLLWLWLGDAGNRELYDSPVTAGTLRHTQQRCQPLINWIVLASQTTNHENQATGFVCRFSANTLPMVLHAQVFPFPHFSISSFLISSFLHFLISHFLISHSCF